MLIYSLAFMALMSYEGQFQNVFIAKAVYWVVVTMTTLGYGDIVFKSGPGYLFTIIVALSGIAILWAVVVPLGITPNLERMIRAAPFFRPGEDERPHNYFRLQSHCGDFGGTIFSAEGAIFDHREIGERSQKYL